MCFHVFCVHLCAACFVYRTLMLECVCVFFPLCVLIFVNELMSICMQS